MNSVLPIQKWQIVQWSTLIIAILFVLILLAQGMKEDSFRLLIRLTARSSCILFLLAFIASSWHKLKPSQVSNWLLQNRRYFGLSMAISHGFHAVAIAGVAVLTSENMVRDNFAANLGYVFILVMTITSFQRPAALLGRRSWKILHTVGMYYLWLSFTVAFTEKMGDSWLFYAPWVIVLISALILRLIVLVKGRKPFLVNN
jgi:methionine sulfoxide reductase heme-binding subunit